MNVRHETELAGGRVVVEYHGEVVLRAGTQAKFTITIQANFDLPPGTEVGLARRWPSDWGAAQWVNPLHPNFVQVSSASGGPVRTWNARLHAWHPFDHAMLLELPHGLPKGRPLTIQCGAEEPDRPGFTVQTFIEEASPLAIRMRLRTESAWTEIARMHVCIVGAEPHQLVLTAPSRVSAGEPFRLHLRVEDSWGNPAILDEPVLLDLPLRGELLVPSSGWINVDAVLSDVGIHRLTARSAINPLMTATSNPVEVVNGPVRERLYWGDPHAQSVIGCGARSIEAYFGHARDFAATDFASHQANCFLVSNAEWAQTMSATRAAHAEGQFVTLLGFEWSAASAYGGDHNLYFPGDTAQLRRCSHEFVEDRSDIDTDLGHVEDLYAHYRGSDTLVALHVGGRTADLKWHEPSLERLLEVHSTHATSEWFLFDALNRGYKLGVTAGSDSVDGRPGTSHPGHMGVRNVRGGLTAVELPALTRSSLWRGLKARHCYGTTGPRILISMHAAGARMGDEVIVPCVPPIEVHVEGTAPLETVDFFRGASLVKRIDLMAQSVKSSNQVRVAWSGASAPGNWQRARMSWNGELQIRGAHIQAVHPFAFDTPDEGILEFNSSQVRWRSITAGDWDGCIIELDDLSSASLLFSTEPMTFTARLDSLGTEPLLFEAVRPERKVEIRRLGQTASPLGWRGSFVDPTPAGGTNAYWIRVRQTDGAYAWSTPIFITLASDDEAHGQRGYP